MPAGSSSRFGRQRTLTPALQNLCHYMLMRKEADENARKLRLAETMLEQERDDAMATIEQLKDKISDNRVAAFVPLVGAGVCGEHCRLTLQDVTEQGGVASRAEGDGAQVRASDGGRARVRDGLVAVVREQRGGEG